MSNTGRALSIMAHPDDAEIFCAGTLARLRDKGYEIHIATMTPGDCGSREHGPSEIAAIRRGEAQVAAGKLEAGYTCLDCRDLHVMYDLPTLKTAVELLREFDPDVVFTHPPDDYMLDHEMTSRVARAACFAAPTPNFDTGRRPGRAHTSRIPHLYYAAPAEGKDLFGRAVDSGLYIDITAVIALKAEMLACHQSQREWLRTQHGMDHYIDEMRRWSAAEGKKADVDFAEGFRQHLGHAYPQNDLLGEVLQGFRPLAGGL